MSEANDREKANPGKKIFVSYSHGDSEFVERLVGALHKAGEDVWWDRWEIMAGDSLVERIFEEGLAQAAAFVVVLSSESVNSRWVRHELDVATIRRIEGVTKIIPVVMENVEVPFALRSLLRVDMRQDFEKGVRRVVNSVHGIADKPERSSGSSIASSLIESVAGLSSGASSVGVFLLHSADPEIGGTAAFAARDVDAALGLGPEATNDAVDELEEAGMVQIRHALGTAPYEFHQVEPTYVLFREFKEYLEYDPEEDVRTTAAAVATAEQIGSHQLAEDTGLSPGRLNRAVEFLVDYGIVDRSQTVGTFPFAFSSLKATRRTRQFVSE